MKFVDFLNRIVKITVGKGTVRHKAIGFFDSHCEDYYWEMHSSPYGS